VKTLVENKPVVGESGFRCAFLHFRLTFANHQ